MNQLIEPKCDEVISDRWISKTGFLAGLQCPKLLWCRHNARRLFPPVDRLTESKFDQGKEVGLLPRTLYPGGRAIGSGSSGTEQVLRDTSQALLERRPLFEPVLTHAGGLTRIDILNPIGRDDWELVEVKSEVEMKDINLQDIAFQMALLAGNGLSMSRCTLMHLDRNYIRHGSLDPTRLFLRKDVTEQAMKLAPFIEDGLPVMLNIVSQPTCPKTAIGEHCDAPFQCPLRSQCWAFLPEHSVLELYRGKQWRPTWAKISRQPVDFLRKSATEQDSEFKTLGRAAAICRSAVP